MQQNNKFKMKSKPEQTMSFTKSQQNPHGSHLSQKTQIIGLLGWLVLCFIIAGIGAAASINARSFYAELIRPDWAPPGAVFGPVWTTLYTLMGIAAWLVWRINGFKAARTPLILFLIQLALNALWSWLFFAWQLGAFSFAEIVVLWLFIVITLVLFWRIRILAGVLLVPYLLWVSFATVLCYTIWQMNPQLL